MPRLSAEEARSLARAFHDAGASLSTYRFDNWNRLTPSTRQRLEDAEWSLLSASSDMVTMSISLTLEDVADPIARVKKTVEKAKKAVENLKDIKQALAVVSALVQLSAALITGNAAAVMGAMGGLVDASKQNDGEDE